MAAASLTSQWIISMPNHKVALIKYDGMELIIVPHDTVFEYKSQEKQLAVRADLQGHAADAGLIGSVCLVWPYAGGMKFLAPKPAHQFFANMSIAKVWAQVNTELLW